MKVGVLTSVHAASDVRILYKECRSLVRAGHDVTLVAPHPHDDELLGVRIKAVRGSRERRLTRWTGMLWRIYREAVRLDADVYHLHDPELLLVGLLLRRRGRLVIYDAHEDLPRTISTKPYVPKALQAPLVVLTDFLERAGARRCSAVVAATPTIGQRFAKINPRTCVVRNYVVLEEWQSSDQVPWPERPAAVVYVGGITWDRGLREMVEAIRLLPSKLGARLLLAGAYSPESVRSDASGLPGWNNVEELGVLGRGQVASLLGRVRAGIVALHPTPNYMASLPIKLFEYMAAGLPLVASDFPVLREIVNASTCGILVDPTNPAAIAAGIAFLLTHPREAEDMGQRGRKAVEMEYSWRTEEQQLLDLYARLQSQLR
jgi:glycosyltransferase involved in cell wall biosynthesis